MKPCIRIGITVLKIVIWGGKSSVLWSQSVELILKTGSWVWIMSCDTLLPVIFFFFNYGSLICLFLYAFLNISKLNTDLNTSESKYTTVMAKLDETLNLHDSFTIKL